MPKKIYGTSANDTINGSWWDDIRDRYRIVLA